MIPKPLTRVSQGHDCGCFIACFAMLTGNTYDDAFRLIHPNISIYGHYHPLDEIGLYPLDAVKRMADLGLKPVKQSLREIAKMERTTLLMIRWSSWPSMAHGVVYDIVTRQCLDPAHITPFSNPFYEKQIYDAYCFDVPVLPHRITVPAPPVNPPLIDSKSILDQQAAPYRHYDDYYCAY